jgi:uncharacterized integral membrane protein
MSAHEPISAPSQKKADRRTRRERSRTAAAVILAILITIFAVLNVNDVKIKWPGGSGQAPLIIVIVVSLLVGALLTHFAERRRAKKR